MKSVLTDLIETGGLRKVLIALADECEQQAEADPMMIKEWMRAANKILKLCQEIDKDL